MSVLGDFFKLIKISNLEDFLNEVEKSKCLKYFTREEIYIAYMKEQEKKNEYNKYMKNHYKRRLREQNDWIRENLYGK